MRCFVQPLVFAALLLGLLARADAQDSTTTSELATKIKAIPGVVDTGLFLGMADTVLIGDEAFELKTEKHRKPS